MFMKIGLVNKRQLGSTSCLFFAYIALPFEIKLNLRIMPAKRKPEAKPAKRKRGHPKVDTSPPPGTDEYMLAPHEILVHWKPGIPTTYEPRFAEALIKHMASGLSFESFGAKIATGPSTMYNWVQIHADFSDAKILGTQLNRTYWENLSKQNSKTNVGNAAGIRFNMINRFRGEWTDSHNVDMTTKGKEINNGPSIDLSKLSPETLRRVLEETGDNSETDKS